MDLKEFNNPLVSIIVPNYNYACYLGTRMESILNQTYQNYEVVILDDNSTDNSLEVIGRYKSYPKITKVIVNKENSGSPFKQWARGIEESSGEIIWIAESDDYCAPNFLEVLVRKHIVNKSVITFCKSVLVNENGDKLRDNHQMSGVKEDVVLPGCQFISDYLGLSNEVQNASCAIFDKAAALSVDKNYMNYKGSGDWLFWIELAGKGIVCYVNQELNYYRLHNNTTKKVVKSGLEFFEMKSIYKRLLDKGLLTERNFKRCRRKNLLLIKSLNEIPHDVKSDLYGMWNVGLADVIYLQWMQIKTSFYKIGIKFLKNESSLV